MSVAQWHWPIVPAELLNEIMGHVRHDEDSTDTLRECSLVNRSMRDISQKLLFREVTIVYRINTASDPDNAFKTATTISIFDCEGEHRAGAVLYGNFFRHASTRTCSFIRKLVIRFSTCGNSISPYSKPFTLPLILPLLRQLNTVQFCRLDGIGSDAYNEIEFHPTTFKHLRESLRVLPPTVTHLDTRAFAIFPLSLLLQYRSVGLKKLTFMRLDNTISLAGSGYQPLRLESLEIGTCSPPSGEALDVSTLRHLKIWARPEFPIEVDAVRTIVDGSQHSLESLEVSIDRYSSMSAGMYPAYICIMG